MAIAFYATASLSNHQLEESELTDTETSEEKERRLRSGRMAIILSFAWWIVSIGGIIYVINAQT